MRLLDKINEAISSFTNIHGRDPERLILGLDAKRQLESELTAETRLPVTIVSGDIITGLYTEVRQKMGDAVQIRCLISEEVAA